MLPDFSIGVPELSQALENVAKGRTKLAYHLGKAFLTTLPNIYYSFLPMSTLWDYIIFKKLSD